MVHKSESTGKRILLIRHGETEWNRIRRFQGRSDLPLNQEGREQAHALALALKGESITAIYSSPLTRAMETARLIRVFHPSVPLFEEEGLVEMDLGEFEGMEGHRWAEQYSDFRKAWQEDPASVKMPGGKVSEKSRPGPSAHWDALSNSIQRRAHCCSAVTIL